MGFWTMLAEKIAIQADGEPDNDRGTRLEKVALQRFADERGLEIDLDPGMWLSDEDEDIAISPDGCEKSDKPTWAAEAKCLSSHNHLKFVIKDIRARETENYNPIDSVPNETGSYYREQVIQYFVVNPDLEKLYFILYDDRIGLDYLVFHVIEINRSDVQTEIDEQKDMELQVLQTVNMLIAELAE